MKSHAPLFISPATLAGQWKVAEAYALTLAECTSNDIASVASTLALKHAAGAS